jgi:rod shape determining protein RodA
MGVYFQQFAWWRRIDWVLVGAVLPLVGAGLITMSSFTGDNRFLWHQLAWLALSLFIFFIFSAIDWRFLRRSGVLVFLFAISNALLLGLLAAGQTIKGAQSWLTLGGFVFQPTDLVKLILILMLAKYFSRRHIAIAQFKHIFVSGLYALIPFLLIFLQPDFGSAIVIFAIWLGIVLVAGLSKKHLLLVFLVGIGSFLILWFYIFQPYQKQRIMTFIHPLADIQGAGYSSFQSTIAVGSGQVLGKGVGYGTQSRLRFLPEYQTDFIFAAFAEEWGFVGALLYFALFAVVVWRVLYWSMRGATNFESIFGVGVAILLMCHFIINIGMNLGLLPVTGLTLPFTSYGGSHLLAEFMALGILMGMNQYSQVHHREALDREVIGLA